MKCEEYQAIIEEYMDGELDRQTALKVSDHLAVCRECADFCDSVRREQQLYARYNRDVEVTPALWAAVHQRIQTSPPHRVSRLREWFGGLVSTPRFSPAIAAALVLITVALTALVMSYLQSNRSAIKDDIVATTNENSNKGKSSNTNENANKDDDSKDGERAAQENETEDSQLEAGSPPAPRPRRRVKREPTPEQLIREAEQKYLAAIAILARDVNRRRSQIDPFTAAQFDTALADIDHTIGETRRAARQNPDDPIALQYMLAAYAKKVDVLREMARN